MTTFISILRGINVSGQKKILMADLKTLYENLHFKNAQTYIQSGNVIFKSDTQLPDEVLAKKIETVIFRQYNFQVPVIIRTLEEIKKIISANPFLKDKNISQEKLHVTFLENVPEQNNLESLAHIDCPPDKFIVNGKEIFLYCPVSYGETKLSNNFFERKLKTTATTRNWKTVNKLAALAGEK